MGSNQITFQICGSYHASGSPADAEGGVHHQEAVRVAVEGLQSRPAPFPVTRVGPTAGQQGLQLQPAVAVPAAVGERRVTGRLEHGLVPATGAPAAGGRAASHVVN